MALVRRIHTRTKCNHGRNFLLDITYRKIKSSTRSPRAAWSAAIVGVVTTRRLPPEPGTTAAGTETPPIKTLVAIGALALSNSTVACAVETFASKGGCGHPALALPPMMSSVLFPLVVTTRPWKYSGWGAVQSRGHNGEKDSHEMSAVQI